MRILVVDDDSSVAFPLVSLLMSYGFEIVVSRPSGPEALLYVENQGCDLVITDLNMPKMNGYELTMKIKELNPDVPVILYSGNSRVRSISNWRNSRLFDAILVKPTPIGTLVESIRSVMGKISDSQSVSRSA